MATIIMSLIYGSSLIFSERSEVHGNDLMAYSYVCMTHLPRVVEKLSVYDAVKKRNLDMLLRNCKYTTRYNRDPRPKAGDIYVCTLHV